MLALPGGGCEPLGRMVPCCECNPCACRYLPVTAESGLSIADYLLECKHFRCVWHSNYGKHPPGYFQGNRVARTDRARERKKNTRPVCSVVVHGCMSVREWKSDGARRLNGKAVRSHSSERTACICVSGAVASEHLSLKKGICSQGNLNR